MTTDALKNIIIISLDIFFIDKKYNNSKYIRFLVFFLS